MKGLKIIHIAVYEIVKNSRDIKLLIGIILMPILLILILGTALEGVIANDLENKVTVGYVNLDQGRVGSQLDAFLDTEAIKEKLDIKAYVTAEVAQKAMEAGTMDVVIEVDKNTSKGYENSKEQTIHIYGKKNLSMVEMIIKNYIASFNAMDAVVKVTGQPVAYEKTDHIERIFIKNAKMPRAIDYYAVMTLLQFLIVGAIFGAFITIKDQGTDLYIRIHSMPISKWTLGVGRMLGSVIYLFGISVFLMLFSKFVYGANWDGNLFIILGALFTFCIASVGIGMLLGLLVKSISAAGSIVFLLMFFLSSTAGSVSPSSALPSLGIMNPIYHAKIIIFGSLYAYPKQMMYEYMLYLLLFIIILFAVIALFFRRGKNDHI